MEIDTEFHTVLRDAVLKRNGPREFATVTIDGEPLSEPDHENRIPGDDTTIVFPTGVTDESMSTAEGYV